MEVILLDELVQLLYLVIRSDILHTEEIKSTVMFS